MRGYRTLGSRWAILAALAVCPGAADAAIHLELRALSPVFLGEPVDVALYAVSDDASEQPIGGIDAIVRWDPAVLSLAGRINNGPYTWTFSWFPDDGNLDGLNDTWADGEALYQCLRQNAPTPPAYATPEGLLVTTFRFSSIGPATASVVWLVPEAGIYTSTRVLDGFDSTNVTGTLRSAEVAVMLCGLASDFDADCDVDSSDYEPLHRCLTGPKAGLVEPPCGSVDLDSDGAVDLRDAAWFQLEYMGP